MNTKVSRYRYFFILSLLSIQTVNASCQSWFLYNYVIFYYYYYGSQIIMALLFDLSY